MLGLLRRLDFLKNLFGADESAAKAKERLRIVLIQDQSNISSELLNVLRHEMIGVVSRYIEIDLPHLEMGIERKEGAIALAASIPILRIRREGRALIADPGETSNGGVTQQSFASVGAPEKKEAQGTANEASAARSKGDRRQRRGRRHLH